MWVSVWQVKDCPANDVAAPAPSDVHITAVTWLAYITDESSCIIHINLIHQTVKGQLSSVHVCHFHVCGPGFRLGKSHRILHTKQTERFSSVIENEVFWLGLPFTLKKEGVESSETSANFYHATRCRFASISHISVLFIVNPVPADNPIHHFLWRKGRSLTKECNILQYDRNEGELQAFCPTVRAEHNWRLHDRYSSDADGHTYDQQISVLAKPKMYHVICGNKMPTRCNRGFYCRSYCLLNMFRAPLCSSLGAQEYYTVVAACGISCCGYQVAGLVWSWVLCVRFAGCAASCKPDT